MKTLLALGFVLACAPLSCLLANAQTATDPHGGGRLPPATASGQVVVSTGAGQPWIAGASVGAVSLTTTSAQAMAGALSATSFSAPIFTSANTTNNGSLNLPFNGTAAAAPGTGSFQISPAINITTPWSLSPSATPGTGFLYGNNTGGVVQQSFHTLAPADFNAGTGASSSTFWRGDGTWATTNRLLTTLTAASGNATVTGNAASQVLATFTVPANTIPALGCLRLEFDAFLSTGTAVAKTFAVAFGSASLSWNADSTGTSGQTYNGTVKICNNNGATGSQVIIARPLLRGATLISGNASFAAAVDTTAAQTLAISWTAPATEIVQVRLMTVELTR